LGTVDAEVKRSERLKQLAGIMTKRENGRLSRTIVNRLWQKFMGRGLVEPVDDMEQPAWSADLLDWLAEDLVDHGYDLKKTIARILTSNVYRLPSVNSGEGKEDRFVFHGPTARRISAEQFRDALGALTGKWISTPATPVDFEAGSATTNTQVSIPAKWIWTEPAAARDAVATTLYLRKEITLEEAPTEAYVVAACDNSFTLYINGNKVGSGKDWKKLELVDVKRSLVKGQNTIAVQAVNPPVESKGKAEKTTEVVDLNPAGFLLQARVRYRPKAQAEASSDEKVMDFGTDSSWLWSTDSFANWEKPEFSTEGWAEASELGDGSMAPWKLGRKVLATLSSPVHHGRIRAALVAADPLMVALGRPNREQVITTRSSVATTLQMLELENGQTLSKLLQQGAEQVLAKPSPSTRDLISRLYEGALGRGPTRQELEVAEELVGNPAKKEGLEDFLWTITMLPEFQLIY